MRWTGNVGRACGQILLALGIVAAVLGIVGLVFGGLLIRDAASNPSMRDGDVGDVVEGLVLGGMGLTAAGTLGIVLGIVVLAAARALRERTQRKPAEPTPSTPA